MLCSWATLKQPLTVISNICRDKGREIMKGPEPFQHPRSSNAPCYFMCHLSCEPLGLKKIQGQTNCTFFSINFQKVSGSHWKIQVGWYICWINIWDYNWSYLIFGLSVITCLVYVWVDCGVIFSWCSDRKIEKKNADKRKKCKTQCRESGGEESLKTKKRIRTALLLLTSEYCSFITWHLSKVWIIFHSLVKTCILKDH